MPNRCQILVPGLFDLPLAELCDDLLERDLPVLNRLLRFANPVPNRNHSIDAMVVAALGRLDPLTECLPVAQAFSDDTEHDHLLVEAVHLHPDLHNAILAPIERSEGNLQDIDILINDLNDLFKADCYISVIADSLYLMRLESLNAPRFYPHPLSVLGKPANPYVEQSRAHLPWYRLLNEIQMFLHQHPVNQRRVAQGMLPINSLWCWGGGPNRSINANFDWYSDDWVMNRFAKRLGLTPRPIDDLKKLERDQRCIIIDLRLLEATKSGQVADLSHLLRDIEARIFLAVNSLSAGVVKLCCGSEINLEFHRWSHLKFWCRPMSLQDWQNRLYASASRYS